MSDFFSSANHHPKQEKNSVFAVYLDISCSRSRALIYLANTIVVNGNQLFMLKMHNNVLSYCSTGSIVIGVVFAELTLYGIPWAAHMYCYKQCSLVDHRNVN